MNCVFVLISGALMCLLLAGVVYGGTAQEASTVAPKATNESSVPLNNSVVAAVAADESRLLATLVEPPCTDCNSEEVADKAADPSTKVNHIDMNK
jgi:hypothetical protein